MPDSAFRGISAFTSLAEGAPIMLLQNLSPSAGLANGTFGQLISMLRIESLGEPLEQTNILLCRFDTDLCRDFPDGLVSIFLSEVRGTGGTRVGFPIVSRAALTAHKSRGMTVPKIW